jgi:hypothetical protein
MDPDSDTKTETKGDKVDPLPRHISNVSDVFSPLWVRRFIQVTDGSNWFILGCRYNFLLHFRMFLVIVYFIFTKSI